jgi:uncharacterized protein (DUF1499 family)
MVSYLPAAGLALALAAVVFAALAGFGSRLNLWHFRTGFAMLKWAACGGVAAVLVSLMGAIAAGRGGYRRGILFAIVGIAVGGAVFAVPYSWRLKAQSVPPIHDITTDFAKPPQFVAILPLRQGAPNPAVYGGPEVAVKQLEAYPDIQPLLLNTPLPQAFEQALAAARAMEWRIVAAEPKEGRIEATDTTFWFGFTDDIVVRITAVDEHRSLVDVRSVSRVGRSDVGTNAARIRKYLQKLKGGR